MVKKQIWISNFNFFASAIVANVESLTQGQIISLIGLFVVFFYLYVIYVNKYKKKINE